MITFRLANVNDLDDCSLLFAIGEEDAPEFAYQGLSDGVLFKGIEEDRVLVAEEDGVIVGMISMFPPPPLGEYATLYMLVTDRAHRDGVLAPKLIAEAQQRVGKAMAVIAPHALDSFVGAGFGQAGYLVIHD